MEKARRFFILLIVLAILALLALGLRSRKRASPAFAVGPTRLSSTNPASFSVGNGFAAMIAPDRSLWEWGTLDRIVPSSEVPQKLGTDNDWQEIAVGFHGLIAIKQDGSLWALGFNNEGFLGLPKTATPFKSLTRIGSDNDWQHVQAGAAHCLALKKDGSLWAWGQNHYGQVGVGPVSPQVLPTRIGETTNWVAISAGAFHSYALRSDGTLWACGQDFTPSGLHTAPYQVGTKTNWIGISAGEYHLAALDSAGTVWIAGANAQLILGSNTSPTTNLVQSRWITNTAQIHSGQNCIFLRLKNGTWESAGDTRSQRWTIPKDFAPAAFHSQLGTTLILMPDGRLWSLGTRVGTTREPNLFQRFQHLILRLFGQTSTLTSTPQNDDRPFLIWAVEGGT